MYSCSAPVQICMGAREGGPFLTLAFKSTRWPTPRFFNENMLSNLQPNHNLGNCFKTDATPLLLPWELAGKELLESEVGCYDSGSDKSSNKDYNSHSDCDSNSNSKGNIRADLARNILKKRGRNACCPGTWYVRIVGRRLILQRTKMGVWTDTRVKSRDSCSPWLYANRR